MKNHLLLPITLLISFFLLLPESFTLNLKEKDLKVATSESIKIRESTIDLQVSIGDKLFVFGKKSGTLDMVKVGMDLLPFSQLIQESNPTIKLRQIGWKRLKNGTVQIISSFDSWPTGLTWSIYPDGKLKMEASGDVLTASSSELPLGLDFDYPEMQLKKVTWKEHSGAWGEWDPESPNQYPPQFFNSIDFVDLTFDQVGVKVKSADRGVGLQWKSKDEVNQNSDIRFVLRQEDAELARISKSSDTPDSFNSQEVSPDKINTSKGMSLWFEFQ
ncbi:hypothetical protein [Algoriphagus taiwanensis]|uniref:Uncharacterized protein n=1 Tax=Algoriphagus taiwanensis TaxID=1445656 RepID=A0ABQ6PY99_9BACT|nr:hypothetical protein Ataiwa_10800 [Algoriphagus taiwanensis]